MSLSSSIITKEHIPIGRLNKPKSHVSEMSVIHVRVAAVGAVVAVLMVIVRSFPPREEKPFCPGEGNNVNGGSGICLHGAGRRRCPS